jgi:PAS domain S-box-containing protein
MTEIIIVDDRVTNRNILHRLSALLEPDAIVHSFAEPKAAIERLREHPCDLIITDFKMPGMNGGEFIQYCRSNIPNFDAPIIVVTAYEDREFRYVALEAGATEFLMSPIDHREFVTRVRNVLALHRQSRELRQRATRLASELDQSSAKHAATLELSEERLRNVVDSNPNFIFTTTEAGDVTLANAAFAAACGMTAEDMLGKKLRHVMPDHFFAERMLLGDEDVRTRRAPTRGETKFQPAHGPDMYMHVSKTAIVGPHTHGIEVLTVLTDITQRRSAEELLSNAKRVAEAANAAKSDFLANMSHELRTPLNAVIGFAELMKKEAAKELATEREEYCGYIISGGQHLLSIISDVLDMAQIEAGKMQLRESSVDLRQLIPEATRLVSDIDSDITPKIKTDFPDDLPPLLVDRAKICQVLVNVIDNALKFSPPTGVVDVRVLANASGPIRIEVSDQGCGMSESEMDVAFSRFGRVGPAVLSHPGTGLGLPLSVELIRMHGGDLSIESQPGKGTKVVITLPEERAIRDAKQDDRLRANAVT